MPQSVSTESSGGSSPTDYSRRGSPSRKSNRAPTAQKIAVCGIGCRLPGDVNSDSKLWELLASRKSGYRKIPKDRFNVDGFYHPNGGDRPGSLNTVGGYFVNENIRNFENGFFGINNMEAKYMDPQQRKLLEVVFECFESAGVPLGKVSGSNTGCYVGNFTIDHIVTQMKDPEYLSRYTATGMGTTILGNRISHAFNMSGPSMVLDTACSSSLYCLHVACVALENGECDAAIVAGANLIQSPEQHIGTMKAGVLSPTSQCHSFDASADGYGRGDGVSALYLKRLDDALRDGDPIRSVIRGSATNANGKTPGITLPSADGQEAVIRKAYAKAGLPYSQTTFVECHGTGTKVGDVIEVEGLSRVFKRPSHSPLLIGSIKSNLGHSEAASGISSVIKSTLALEHLKIPPIYGLTQINPKLKIKEWNIDIPTELTPWPEEDQLTSVKRVSINSFGYGGANAHAILDRADSHVPKDHGNASKIQRQLGTLSSVLLPISAATPESLEHRVKDLAHSDHAATDVLDLAYTLGQRRTHLSKRGFLLAKTDKPIAESLRNQILQTVASSPTDDDLDYAFVFTGQGAQWPEMCKELFTEFSVFRDAISEMDTILQSLPHAPSWTLREAILEPAATSSIHHATKSQPTCTAIQVALVQLLETWDIRPSATFGHSSGEIAAAFASGKISAGSAITFAYYRGYVVGNHSSSGSMMAVGLSEIAAQVAIDDLGLEGQVNIACVNSPESMTISGDTPAIEKLFKSLQSRDVFARKLNTGSQAYHSHHMKAIGFEYQKLMEEALKHLDLSYKMPPGPVMISSVTGELLSSKPGPEYWRSNLESPVLFSHTLERLSREGKYHIVEIGPHSALELPIKQIRSKLGLSLESMPYSAAIKRNANSLDSVLGLAGSFWLYGRDIDFGLVNGLTLGGKVGKSTFKVLHDLPRYRWHYTTELWNETRASIEFKERKHVRHELLGSQIPGGDGIHYKWRNMLHVDDVSWLKDHKLGDTIVFPGAGYLAMAIEAASQVSQRVDQVSFILEKVNILTALPLSTEPSSSVEIFTSLRRSPITRTSASEFWWDFEISSYQDRIATPHASGSIAVTEPLSRFPKFTPPADSLEPNAKRVWYDSLAKHGLKFGPTFQSIEEFQTPRLKSFNHCSARLALLREVGEDREPYFVHPITLDAMFQSSIIATSAGNTADLRGKVPTQIERAVVSAPRQAGTSGIINSNAACIGFGTANCNSEIVDTEGTVVAQFHGIRLTPYDVSSQEREDDKRHPMLRVLWKPDAYGLGVMSSHHLTTYLDEFFEESVTVPKDETLIKLGATLNLLAHKNSGLRILELGNDIHPITQAATNLLGSNTAFKRFRTYTCGILSDQGDLVGAEVDLESGERRAYTTSKDQTFDLVFLPLQATADLYLTQTLSMVRSIMAPGATILALNSLQSDILTSISGLESVSSALQSEQNQITVALDTRHVSSLSSLESHNTFIIDRSNNPLGNAIADSLKAHSASAPVRMNLREVTEGSIPPGATVFCLAECQVPLMSTISNEDMTSVKHITNNAKNIVWVTGGSPLDGTDPEFGLISGIARALVLEQPSVNFYTYSVDNIYTQPEETAENLMKTLVQGGNSIDKEFVQRQGVVHVSRYVPDDNLNSSFRQQRGDELVELPLSDASPLKLAMQRPGQLNSIFWLQTDGSFSLGAHDVQVQVKAIGLTAKDYAVLSGKATSLNGTCSLEYSGLVERVGAKVSGLKSGDRVLVMAPSPIQTTQIVPDWACKRLQDQEDFSQIAGLPVAFATALYALHDRAHIQATETVLVHSAASAVGSAAVQIAQLAGATVFATVSSDIKREYLVRNFGIPPSHIFSSKDTSFLAGILEVTGGKGVDVVLNTLPGDLLHASWRCCARFGRFVELGKHDLTSSGRLEMDQFLQNSTFTAFELSDLFDASPAKWSALLDKTLSLYREGKISMTQDIEVHDVSEIVSALRSFNGRERISKIVISLQNGESKLQVQPPKYRSRFSSFKTYIMIGCLGGLGRSLSKWMMQRGAKKFVFLGRSGLDKAPARRLVEELQRNGADCTVVRGDVCHRADIDKVVEACDSTVGGVIQAAMGLNEALFTNMSNDFWHTGIDPKVQGTFHLHSALRGKDSELEFFLMTSSISGTVGTATEANYCSANYFLDQFARYRRGQGLPATSVGLGMISEVGYLHENPEIEALLLRKGIQAISEDELLHIVDISLSSAQVMPHSYDQLAYSHVLTGLEPHGLRELRKKGFDGTNPALDDPRATVLAGALYGQGDVAFQSNDGLPAEVAEMMEKGTELPEAVLRFVTKRFGNLILTPADQVDSGKPLAGYGMDSMIAAEFRTWFFQAFKVDVPFLTLLSKTSTVKSLSDMVVSEVGQ